MQPEQNKDAETKAASLTFAPLPILPGRVPPPNLEAEAKRAFLLAVAGIIAPAISVAGVLIIKSGIIFAILSYSSPLVGLLSVAAEGAAFFLALRSRGFRRGRIALMVSGAMLALCVLAVVVIVVILFFASQPPKRD